MKQIIILLNNAGGVGKTAAVASLAGMMAAEGKRILAVDLDGQATLTRQYIPGFPDTDIGSVLMGGPVPVISVQFGLDIVPATPRLANLTSSDTTWLKDALAPLKKTYDYILVDCPPSLGHISRCAIAAADFVLSPVLPDLKSLYGLQQLEDVVDMFGTKAEPGIDGVFFANFNGRRGLDRDVEAKLHELYPDKLFNVRIGQCNKLRECLRGMTDIQSYAPRSSGAYDYRKLLDELLTRLN